MDVGGLSMMLIDQTGKLGRVMAIPQPDQAQRLLEVFGLPGFDATGRLIYSMSSGMDDDIILCCVEHPGRHQEPAVEAARTRQLTGPRGSGGRGGGGSTAGRGGNTMIPEFIVHATVAEVPDYVPPIAQHAVVGDAENNL